MRGAFSCLGAGKTLCITPVWSPRVGRDFGRSHLPDPRGNQLCVGHTCLAAGTPNLSAGSKGWAATRCFAAWGGSWSGFCWHWCAGEVPCDRAVPRQAGLVLGSPLAPPPGEAAYGERFIGAAWPESFCIPWDQFAILEQVRLEVVYDHLFPFKLLWASRRTA